jgi:hypothetical protein
METLSSKTFSTAATDASAKHLPHDMRLVVRTYRHGLGDCHLLSLISRVGHLDPQAAPSFHMMIDCGVILGTEGAHEKIEDVLDSVYEETGGAIDVLVVTHQHYDHVSGFLLALDRFESFDDSKRSDSDAGDGRLRIAYSDSRKLLRIKEIWLAWTEDPRNEDAQRLTRQREDSLRKLREVVTRLNMLGMKETVTRSKTGQVLRFFGVNESGKSGWTTQDAMNNIRRLVPDDEHIRYLSPGEFIEPPTAPGLRFYVLGPPRDDAALRKLTAKDDVYHIATPLLNEAVGLAARSARDDETGAGYEPFDRAWGHPLHASDGSDLGATSDFLKDRYFGPESPTEEADISWRQIENNWLYSSEAFAMALDKATNNTSLVMAIELIASKNKEVLLFAADAQVGSWRSWHSLEWSFAGESVTAKSLLKRLAFYKVSHHGSGNATPKQCGVEFMSKRFVSFIPVDGAKALDKGWGKMPLTPLVAALREGKRVVVRTDEELPDIEDCVLPEGSALSSGREGKKIKGPCYYAWTVTFSSEVH